MQLDEAVTQNIFLLKASAILMGVTAEISKQERHRRCKNPNSAENIPNTAHATALTTPANPPGNQNFISPWTRVTHFQAEFHILCKQLDLDSQTQHIWHGPERAGQTGPTKGSPFPSDLGHQNQPQNCSKSAQTGLAQPGRAQWGFLSELKRTFQSANECLLPKRSSLLEPWQSGKGCR